MKQSELAAIVDFLVERFDLDLSLAERDELEADIENAASGSEDDE